jgi:acetyltransferase
VFDYDELVETSQLLASSPAPCAAGVAVVSSSGGMSSLAADLCGYAGLPLPPLTEQAQADINRVLAGRGWASNPADISGAANTEEFPYILERMLDEPEVGTLITARAGSPEQLEPAIKLRQRKLQDGKNVVHLWVGRHTDQEGLGALSAAGVPVFFSPRQLGQALARLQRYHAWRGERLRGGFATAPALTAGQKETVAWLEGLGRRSLSEVESRRVLAAWGIPLARAEQANSSEAAVAAAGRLGYPVAMKVDSAEILHKTEAGGVRLGLGRPAEVQAAFAEIGAVGGTGRVLVEEMVSGGVEVIVGVSYNEQVGPVLLFGSGGVMAEVYEDVALRRCPITPAEAQEAIASVKASRLLAGFRGRPKADVDALANCLVRVSHLAVHLEGKLAELDINPVMVLPAGQGVKAVDALAVLSQPQTSG